MVKTSRPMHELQMAAPCSADWEQMQGTERMRSCLKCRLKVYRVSDLTREEAEAVVARAEGHACLSLYRRQDGTVLAADCPRGIEAQRKASRWWKERVFHLFMLVWPWMILTWFIYIDTQRDTYFDLWDNEPFKTVDKIFGSRSTTSIKFLGLAAPPPPGTIIWERAIDLPPDDPDEDPLPGVPQVPDRPAPVPPPE